MRFIAIALTVALIPALSVDVRADKPCFGTLSLDTGVESGKPIEGRSNFMEGWNVDEPIEEGRIYAVMCFAYPYQPGLNYWLDRVEFIAGEGTGTVSIEIRADDGSGYPTGPVLASGSYEQVDTMSWQGADLSPCVFVEQGVTYWVVLQPIVGSRTSTADMGTAITHLWSGDCVTWEGPTTSLYWMAKFFGGLQPSATDLGTWGAVKALYR
jgi:hypothetical protein